MLFDENLIYLSLGTLASKSLVSFPKGNSTRSIEVCCNDKNLGICLNAEVNPDLLLDEKDISILDIDLVFHSTIQPNGFVYKNSAGDEAVITYREASGNMFGSVKTREGRSFAIEKCKGGHVVKEYDIASFPGDTGQKVLRRRSK